MVMKMRMTIILIQYSIIMTNNTSNINNKGLEEAKTFTYLGLWKVKIYIISNERKIEKGIHTEIKKGTEIRVECRK